MYLTDALILQSGPIVEFSIQPEFQPDGSPKPVVLVGSNGSGKTTVLSVIADSLIELAATHFRDVAPEMAGGHRYYRLLGGNTRRASTQFEFIATRFRDGSTDLGVVERSGTIPPNISAQYSSRFSILRQPVQLDTLHTGPANKIVFPHKPDVTKIFRTGSYVFFPSNRSEIPAWCAPDNIDLPGGFDAIFENELSKPIVLEKAIQRLKPWLIDVMLDSSVDFYEFVNANNLGQLRAEIQGGLRAPISLNDLNQVISTILDETDIHVVRTGRFLSHKKIQIAKGRVPFVPTLEALSAGQISLLSIFGTIIRYGDLGRMMRPDRRIEGIVCVDEADAHLHPKLQYSALPKLISQFPNVQFFVTSHSPLFPLGMERQFGADGFTLVETPDGGKISVECYSDFLGAFEAFSETELFKARIEAEVKNPGRPRIFCEGETDPQYLRTAARVLGFQRLVDQVDLEWIGSIVDGQVRNGGSGALDNALKLFRAKPDVAHRPLVLLYDGDESRADDDIGIVHVRSTPSVSNNSHSEGGIETLLPDAVFEDRFYTRKMKLVGTTETTIRELRKVEFCDHLCSTADPAVFEGFRGMLEMLDELLFGQGSA